MLDKISITFLQLLATQPYEAITVRQITKAVGIPRTSFYNSYDSKDDLASTLLMQELEPALNYIAQKFTNRQADNRVTEEGLQDLLVRREIIGKLWNINTPGINLTAKLEKAVSKSAQEALRRYRQTASADSVAFFGELFAACFVKTMEWYYARNDQATTKQLVQRINACLYDGMIHLVDA